MSSSSRGLRAWRGWAALNFPARSPRLLLLNDSFLRKRRARLEHIARIRTARERVWLATPYFVPVGHLYRLLVKRARAGLAMLYQATGRADTAEQAIRDMVRITPTQETYALAARLFTMFGRRQDADAVRADARRAFGASRQGR